MTRNSSQCWKLLVCEIHENSTFLSRFNVTAMYSPSPYPDSSMALQHMWDTTDSVILTIVAESKNLLICGTQNGRILVYDLVSFSLVCDTIEPPELVGSNLCLELTPDDRYLFAAGSDSVVKIYDLSNKSLNCIWILYCSIDIGDIFSLYYCEPLSTLFIGCQNASLIWHRITFNENSNKTPSLKNLPHLRYNKFFDSTGPGGRKNKTTNKQLALKDDIDLTEITIGGHNSINFAHYGYIYSLRIFINEFMKLKYPKYPKFLISGGGDGMINIWGIQEDGEEIKLVKLHSFFNNESILTMNIHNTYLYAGLLNGEINVWDLLTFQLIRVHSFEQNQVSSVVVSSSDQIYYASKAGLNSIIKSKHIPINKDSILSVFLYEDSDTVHLITGGNKLIKYYRKPKPTFNLTKEVFTQNLTNDILVKNLSQFVSFKTISQCSGYIDESRNCAKFLIKILDKFGAFQNHVIPVDNRNPIIISTFKSNTNKTNPKKILYYGHYDVVDAENDGHWDSDPFEMTSKNGYLYGRGVSDNKGPTLAVIQAIGELFQTRKLDVDFTFVIEGEEENGSAKFRETILENQALIGDIDYIFLSNSYWLDDDIPCLNYGLRGVLNCSIEIESEKPDRHSGVDGGVSKEPTMDLIQLLNTLTDPMTNKIAIPNFYDQIQKTNDEELGFFQKIVDSSSKFKLNELITRWTQPSLTVHKIEVSGPNNETIIPKTVKGSLSLRIVPNQSVADVKKQLTNFLTNQFEKLKSENSLNIKVSHEVEPWLGDYNNEIYKILLKNINKNWGVTPLLIREGGSIPSIRFLEKTFKAPACQIPCGQGSDNAHLQNEKLRLVNLFKLKDILKDTISDLA